MINYKKTIEKLYCLPWIVQNYIRGEGGDVLEFRKHSFLIDIFDDWTPIQTTLKASQVGFSTMEIIKSFWAMKNRGWNIVYTLPTFSDVSQFVPSKVNAIIGHNPILGEWTKDKDTILQKKVGNNFIYYRGTQGNKSAEHKIESGVGIMFTADLLIMDEADRSDQNSLQQYESRLEASDYKGRWYFSNPTHPNTLTQQLWEKSDQKHWFVKCSHCGHWQYLSYPESIKDGKFVCKKCGREITDEDRINGRWVKKYQNRDVSGYWISQLIAPWHSAKEIEEKAKTKTKDYFNNFVLGLPYRGGDRAVDRDMILGAIDRTTPNFLQDNVMGVDVGLTKHYVIGNKQGIFKVGTAKDWEEIEFLMKKYDIRVAVFDALPDLTEPRKLQQKYLGIVWLSYFKREIKKADFIVWDGKSHTVYSDRGKMLGMLIDELADRKIRFQMKIEELETYIKHWDNVYRTKEIDNMGLEHEIWDTSGENHFCLATLYWRLALERIGGSTTIINTATEKIGTPAASNVAPTMKKIMEGSEEEADWRV